jgi:hypothetical protein
VGAQRSENERVLQDGSEARDSGEIGDVVGKRNVLAVDGSPIPTKSSPPSDAGTKALDSIHRDDGSRNSLNLIPDWNVRP